MRVDSFKVGLVQMAMGADVETNRLRAVEQVRAAAGRGAQVICLPELFCTPYLCQVEDTALFDLAETIPGPSTEVMGEVARQQGVVIAVPLFERRAPGLYHNSVAIMDADGSLAGVYRKMHIPDDPAYYEKFYFTPGDLGFKTFDTRIGRIGVLICWDQWFAEAARLTALRGAEVILCPTAIGWHPEEKAEHGHAQQDAWQTVQRGHAIANGVYLAAANRVGHEKPPVGGAGIEFWGHSFICDPQGRVLAQADASESTVLFADVDRGRMEDVRRNWPFLRDRRVDAYGGITERFLDGETPE